jgi:hypothetical protein
LGTFSLALGQTVFCVLADVYLGQRKKTSKEKVVFCYYLPKGGSLLHNNFSPIQTSGA